MSRVMKAFDGKSKTTQHKIAADIDSRDIDHLNFFDLIHGYCSDLASVGDTRQPVNHVDLADDRVVAIKIICGFCQAPGHKEADCRRKKNKDKKCNYCGKQYHDEPQCHKERKDQRTVPPVQPSNTTQLALPQTVNNTQDRVNIS